MTDPIPFTERQSLHLCLHPLCFLYRRYSRMGTEDEAVWIAPAPVWTRQGIFDASKGLFAGYGVGVYNQTGILHRVGSHTYPLQIWQGMAREAVIKAQRKHEEEINATRSPEAQIKGIESCFT